MLNRRYRVGVILTIPIGVLLGGLGGGAFDGLGTGWGSPGAFIGSGMLLGGGTALGAMLGGLLATRRVHEPAGSSIHLLSVALAAGIGGLGFWIVIALAATVAGGILFVPALLLAALVAGTAAAVVSAAGVGTADLVVLIGRTARG